MNMSGLPHSPYTVKNLRPINFILNTLQYNSDNFSLITLLTAYGFLAFSNAFSDVEIFFDHHKQSLRMHKLFF